MESPTIDNVEQYQSIHYPCENC